MENKTVNRRAGSIPACCRAWLIRAAPRLPASQAGAVAKKAGKNRPAEVSFPSSRIAGKTRRRPGLTEDVMATRPPNFEIPTEMRDMAEKSVEQARKAFDGFMGAAFKAAGTLEDSSDVLHAGSKDISRKALTYAEQNVAAALDFASRLVKANDPQHVLQLQSEFVRSQLQAFGEQAKDIGSSAGKLATDVAKPRK
jgi:phasin